MRPNGNLARASIFPFIASANWNFLIEVDIRLGRMLIEIF